MFDSMAARDSRLFTVLEELRADMAELKQRLNSIERRMVHSDAADNIVNVLQEWDLPLKDTATVTLLENKLQDKAYQQCVVSCFCFCRMQLRHGPQLSLNNNKFHYTHTPV